MWFDISDIHILVVIILFIWTFNLKPTLLKFPSAACIEMFMQTSFSVNVLFDLSLVKVLVGLSVQEIRAVSMSPDVLAKI